jgi:hypothetical protein
MTSKLVDSPALSIAAIAAQATDGFVAPDAVHGVVDAQLIALDDDDHAWVALPWSGGVPARARWVVAPMYEALGQHVAVVCERGDPARPLIIGAMYHPPASGAPTADDAVEADAPAVRVLDAREAIVLQVGEATLTLTADGTIYARGATVVTHASRLNRVRGASVRIN